MRKNPTMIGRLTMVVVTIVLVVVYQFIFAAKCSPESLVDLIYPPSVVWIGCFVVGVILGEAVRRSIHKL